MPPCDCSYTAPHWKVQRNLLQTPCVGSVHELTALRRRDTIIPMLVARRCRWASESQVSRVARRVSVDLHLT
ncbi:unnamed protein product, partial [Ectocarpus sp. 13 AM-2016]